MTKYEETRAYLQEFYAILNRNVIQTADDFCHSIQFYFQKNAPALLDELQAFGVCVAGTIEPLVAKNNLASNLPRLEPYNAYGQKIDTVIHHPHYGTIGDLIYQTKLLARMAKLGGLSEALSFFFLASHAGEAGHNCPIACSAGIIRILTQFTDVPQRDFYLQKLTAPSFRENFTGAQFVTEIQGGSDVGQNASLAVQDHAKQWRISGEKWFCSNANADLVLLTARFDPQLSGTKGLGLFLLPRILADGTNNYFHIRRLKQKLGTCSMATAEFEFAQAHAYLIGDVADGFHLLMENILHLSRIFNAFSVLGMARRAYQIAKAYAAQRQAFGNAIGHYPLVQENLARIKTENTAMLAGAFTMVKLQDAFDQAASKDPKTKLLLRLLVNLTKYFTALHSVEHIHHCIDILAGNGTIESFSALPRLLRDCIICENWEGTHYTLWMQILRDMHKVNIDVIFVDYIQQALSNLAVTSNEVTKLAQALDSLVAELADLKRQDERIQQLRIKNIVAKMAAIFMAFSLFQEAQHQIETANNHSKLDCWRYFYNLHLSPKTHELDKDYLALISKFM